MGRVTLFTYVCFVSWAGIVQEGAEMVDSSSVAEVSEMYGGVCCKACRNLMF